MNHLHSPLETSGVTLRYEFMRDLTDLAAEADQKHVVLRVNQSVSTHHMSFGRDLQGVSHHITWDQNGDGRLHSLANDVVQCEHPVRFDVVVSQHFIHLKT